MLRRLIINHQRSLTFALNSISKTNKIRPFSTNAESPKETTTEPTPSPSTNNDDKLASLQDSYLRALADMENLRQRTRREVESASLFAIQRFAKDVIGIADVLETALLQSAPGSSTSSTSNANTSSSSTSSQALQKGLEMTLEELRKVLKSHGVVPIDPLHQRFDPNLHMALYELPDEQAEPGTVMAVQKKGYLLNGRVIRAAQVAVSKKA